MKILCVHPNSELYGSDRSFLQALEAVREIDPTGSIDVRLVAEGPISPHVAKYANILYGPMWVLRKTDIKKMMLTAPVSFPLAVWKAYKTIRQSGCDLLYINTLVPLDYLIAARFFKGRKLCHVREIPTGKAMSVFAAVLKFSGCGVIYNSNATRDAFGFGKDIETRVIYNGVAPPAADASLSPMEKLKVLLIGRFNSWKGQKVLVKALAGMNQAMRDKIEVRLVGGVYGDQNHFIDDVKSAISEAKLEQSITLHPFVDDPSGHYEWSDVVAVPSTLPEPFGRVAIEGMSYGRPVVATNHGGLAEIVDDGETGLLVEPGSEVALAKALEKLVADRQLCQQLGKQGYDRFMSLFSEEGYKKNITAAFGLG